MIITSGVTAILDVIIIVLGLLGDATREEALALLGDNIGDVTALGLEVVLHDARLVLTAVILEYRHTREIAHTVRHTDGMHLTTVHVHADLRRRQIHVAIKDLALAIHRRMIASDENDAILSIELHHMVQIHLDQLETTGVLRQDDSRSH